jgi:hypothetical protein
MYRLCLGLAEALTVKEHDVRKYLRVGLVAGLAFVMAAAASASANAPVTVTSVVTFEEQVVAPGARPVATNGFMEAPNECSFPIVFSAHATETDTTFDNGDKKTLVNKNVTRQANGHTASETDIFQVFIDQTDPSNLKITGRFGQMFVDGELIWLESGRLASSDHGTLVDPHPGPMGAFPDLCKILSE